MTRLQRFGWMGVVALCGAASVAFSAFYRTSPPEDAPVVASGEGKPATVLVRQELVGAEIVYETPPGAAGRPTAQAMKPAARRREAPAAVPASAAGRERPAAPGRALRMILGDGRHRPQPFPTVKQP